jgi:hypothetical protein
VIDNLATTPISEPHQIICLNPFIYYIKRETVTGSEAKFWLFDLLDSLKQSTKYILKSVHLGFLGNSFGLLQLPSSKLDKNDMGEWKSDQV